jgi:AcrR family transcriptional regulator
MFEALTDDAAARPGRDGALGEAGHQPRRRHLSDRQAEAVERLVVAAAAEVEDRAYGEISVRSIAKRAGVATATAYTYFSSKDHLLAEVLWRRMRLSPQLVDLNQPLPERVAETVRSMGFGTVDSPAAVSACTTALLGDGPDVKEVRARIGDEIGHRLRAALGPEADAAMLPILQITYVGAILSAGMGHLRFAAVPDLIAEAARLMEQPST